LTGQPVFSKELTAEKIRFMVAIEHKLPDIPKFVLPSARKLITDCWATEPSERHHLKTS
jgi:hypothetical protein